MHKPVFVIGKDRSGTKWLSNIIAKHSSLAAVQGEGFGGILESNLFLTFPAVFGSLREKENYCAMAACYSKTSFFRCTGLDESVLFEKKIDSYGDFFRHVMGAYAEKQGKPRWLQKANHLVLPQLYAAFPDARFVIINRSITANIRSSIALARQQGYKGCSVFSEMALYHLGKKTSSPYRAKPNVMSLAFEDLKENRASLTKTVCDFLDLGFEDRMLEDAFEKNTSFKSKTSRAKALSRTEERCISLFGPLIRLIPLRLLKVCRSMFGRSRNPNRSRFIEATFSILRKEYGWPNES